MKPIGWAFVVGALVGCIPSVVGAQAQRSVASGRTLSASSTDPFVNTVPATSDTTTVYVWLWCVDQLLGGVTSASSASPTWAVRAEPPLDAVAEDASSTASSAAFFHSINVSE